MKAGTGAGAEIRPRAVQSQAASPPELLACPATAMPVIDMRVPRDAAFKRFVLHPTFIRHLLGAYPLTGLDPALVERVEDAAANLVGPDLSQRLADAVWRLRLRDGRTAYLLVECQSQPDPAMPYRMLHAVATLALALSRDPPPGLQGGTGPADPQPDRVQRAGPVAAGRAGGRDRQCRRWRARCWSCGGTRIRAGRTTWCCC